MQTLCDITKITFLRVKTEEELKKTALLAAEIWREYYPQILGDAQVEYMVNTYQSFEAMAKVASSGCMYFIIRYGDADAGYMAVEPNNPDGKLFLSKLYLKSEMRGKKISYAAWEKIKEIAKEYGIKKVWLTVNKSNAPSIAVYEKLGFKMVDSVVNPIGNGFVMDDYVMEREI